jgi:AraC-like DNA-binding protein
MVFISFTAASRSPIIWRGRALAPDELMLHGQGEHLHQRIDGPSRWGMLSMSPAWLADVCKTENGRDFAPLPAGQIIRPRPRDRQGLNRVHGQASRLAETRPAILGNPGVVRAMEQEFEGLLARCLIDGEIRPEPAAAQLENDLMQRFETSLASCPQRSRGTREWATTLGVSTGTLNRVCLAFLGVSARRYAQLRQLVQARIAIRSAGPGTARIADLARQAGFPDPARFAALYKAAFGETPSGTLRRAGTA